MPIDPDVLARLTQPPKPPPLKWPILWPRETVEFVIVMTCVWPDRPPDFRIKLHTPQGFVDCLLMTSGSRVFGHALTGWLANNNITSNEQMVQALIGKRMVYDRDDPKRPRWQIWTADGYLSI